MAKRPVNYISRDFESIKQSLIDHAKRYYPDTFKDFNEASFGSLMLDAVSYIGDNLSFYVDYQANESFLDSAIETDNITRLARQMGYKQTGTTATEGIITVYVLVPASTTSRGPNIDYIPIMKKGTTFNSETSGIFTLQEDIDFADPANEVVVGRVNEATGDPTYYAIKSKGKIISGELNQETFAVGTFTKFLRLKMDGLNISEIVSIRDSEGNEYYQVPYLSQNVIYEQIVNNASDKSVVPYNLRIRPVPRRFMTEFIDGEVFLQFGFGSEGNLTGDLVADPADVVLDVHGRNYVTDDSFDPSNLIKNDKFGVVPTDTILTVIYRSNSTTTANASVNTVTSPSAVNLVYKSLSSLDSTVTDFIESSIESTNEQPIIGDVTAPTQEEIRMRAFDSYASQNRAVTKQDYIALCYRMPGNFGSIKRAAIAQDRDSFKRNLNLYVISEDQDGNFINPPTSLLNNLKSWLNQYKMINDTIDILPGKIVNLQIDFEVVTDLESNRFDVINECINRLKIDMAVKKNIGEPFYITELFKTLNSVPGVVDTISVNVDTKTDAGYSQFPFDIELNTSPDGRILYAPSTVVFEIKAPDQDIQGIAR
jgi:hypothetical protein